MNLIIKQLFIRFKIFVIFFDSTIGGFMLIYFSAVKKLVA